MTIYALLNGTDKKGRITFHGLTTNVQAAETWESSGNSRWFQDFETATDGGVHDVRPEPIANPAE